MLIRVVEEVTVKGGREIEEEGKREKNVMVFV